MELFAGIALIIAVAGSVSALEQWVKAKNKGLGQGEARRILDELKALRGDVAELQSGRAAAGVPGRAGANSDVIGRLDQLQQEIAALRDTTTQFDMSFDAALDRLERRLDRVETGSSVAAAGSADEPRPLVARK